LLVYTGKSFGARERKNENVGTIAEPRIKRWTTWISIPLQIQSQNITSGYSRVNPDNGWAEESSEEVMFASNQARCEPSNTGNVSPEATTGVPNKNYRGPQQGSRCSGRPLAPPKRANKPKTRLIRPLDTPLLTYRGAQQELPGCPTRTTGVPNKKYRGAQQKVPGCPTRTTGVPNKKYRGAQQVALLESAAKYGFLCRVFGPLCFSVCCSVMFKKQQLQGERGGRS
jgi:hypothetical protein